MYCLKSNTSSSSIYTCSSTRCTTWTSFCQLKGYDWFGQLQVVNQKEAQVQAVLENMFIYMYCL